MLSIKATIVETNKIKKKELRGWKHGVIDCSIWWHKKNFIEDYSFKTILSEIDYSLLSKNA